MSIQSKLRAARKRAHAKLLREQEARKLDEQWEKVKAMGSGIRVSSGVEASKKSFATEKAFRRETPRHPSLRVSASELTLPARPQLSPEMEAREQKALLEIEAKKKRTAPVYNKGGYQYLTDDMIDDMRNGTLRRR